MPGFWGCNNLSRAGGSWNCGRLASAGWRGCPQSIRSAAICCSGVSLSSKRCTRRWMRRSARRSCWSGPESSSSPWPSSEEEDDEAEEECGLPVERVASNEQFCWRSWLAARAASMRILLNMQPRVAGIREEMNGTETLRTKYHVFFESALPIAVVNTVIAAGFGDRLCRRAWRMPCSRRPVGDENRMEVAPRLFGTSARDLSILLLWGFHFEPHHAVRQCHASLRTSSGPWAWLFSRVGLREKETAAEGRCSQEELCRATARWGQNRDQQKP